MRSLNTFVWRGLLTHRLRTVLSTLAVALGVAITIASSLLVESIRKAILFSEEARAIAQGMIDQLDPMMTFVSVVIMLAVGFLIFNAFAMSITQRRQEIGALRALGTTQRQIMRLAFTEALIVGGSGTVLGLIGGPLLGLALVGLMRRVASNLFAFEEAAPTAFSVGLAVALGIAVSLLAMLFPARRAAHTPPLAALREPDAASVEKNPVRRALVGLVIALALFVYLLVAPPGYWVTYPMDGTLAILLVVVWLAALLLIVPAFIGWLASGARRLFGARFGATGRLIADNLQRGRGRVMLTVLTLTVGLAVITGVIGFTDFLFGKLLLGTMRAGAERPVFAVAAFDPTQGFQTMAQLSGGSLSLGDDEVQAVSAVSDGRAVGSPIYYLIVPELSALGSAYFSWLMDSEALHQAGKFLVDLPDAGWQTALPIMQSGCGMILSPMVATRNNVKVGDRLTITGARGPVECRVAGIGRVMAGASIISLTAATQLGVGKPIVFWIMPNAGVDADQLENDLRALQGRFPGLAVMRMAAVVSAIGQGVDFLNVMMNGTLLLAILAAALGVINTMMMSVSERRREIGLLRAVGATRRQTRAIIMGEAALIGLAGGVLGLVAGVGATLVFVVTYGSNGWGLSLPLWPTALESARLGLGVGLIGLLAAPVISALAAWLPAWGILRGKPIETLALQ